MAEAPVPSETSPPVAVTSDLADIRPPMFAGCVILTPSRDSSAWIAAIERAATIAGLGILVDDGSAGTSDPEMTIVVTSDPARAKGLAARNMSVVIASLDDAAAAGADIVNGDLKAGAVHATAVIAGASLLDSSNTITPARMQAGTVCLWPGLEVETPPARPASNHSQDDAVFAAAMDIYRDGRPEVGASAKWQSPIFQYDPKRAERRANVWELDVTGPARYLVFGPYLTLTPGLWRSTVQFAVDGDAAGLRYRAEWGTTTGLVSEAFSPGRAGVFEMVLEYEFVEAAPAEFRMVLEQGSLGGSFDFLGMDLERIG